MFFFCVSTMSLMKNCYFFSIFQLNFIGGSTENTISKLTILFATKKVAPTQKKIVHQKFICLQDCWKLKPNNIKNSLLLISTFPLILTNPPNVPSKKISKGIGIHFTFLRLNKVLCWMNVYKHNNCNGIAETFSFFRALDNNWNTEHREQNKKVLLSKFYCTMGLSGVVLKSFQIVMGKGN